MTHPREAHALERARHILATDPTGYRHSPPVEEPDDFAAMFPEDDNESESNAAAADMVFGREW